MNYRADQSLFEGSAARKLDSDDAARTRIINLDTRTESVDKTCTIIEFPSQRNETCVRIPARQQHARGQLNARIREIAYTSDFYCSLRFEDSRGIPFDTFSKRQVVKFSAALISSGVLCLFLSTL